MKIDLQLDKSVAIMKGSYRTVYIYDRSFVHVDDATGITNIMYSSGDEIFLKKNGEDYWVWKIQTHDGHNFVYER